MKEGLAILCVKSEKIPTKKMEVFYNPVMELNRTISILLLKALGKKDMQIALPLAGSGIRAARMMLELPASMIKEIYCNDMSPSAIEMIGKHLKENKITKKVSVSQDDANLFMLKSKGFDYIDIDPFGSPNEFLDSALRRISRGGILAVTATDTSSLCGTHPKAGRRKYWAKIARHECMHEIGLRILIRKCQLVGAQYDKALTPIYSYAQDHYMRVFFSVQKGKTRVDDILKKHAEFDSLGPMWLGRLWDAAIAKKIGSDHPMISMIAKESQIDCMGFHDIGSISLSKVPKQAKILEALKKKKYHAAPTHFAKNGIRCAIDRKEFLDLLRKL